MQLTLYPFHFLLLPTSSIQVRIIALCYLLSNVDTFVKCQSIVFVEDLLMKKREQRTGYMASGDFDNRNSENKNKLLFSEGHTCYGFGYFE